MSAVHLVKLPVNQREFTSWALDRGYLSVPRADGRGRPKEADIGYALHSVLSTLFGAHAPRPFAVPEINGHRQRSKTAGPGRSCIDLLGYTDAPLDTLRTLAELADDELQNTINWDGAKCRPMPQRWPKNIRLRFDLRACPVRRLRHQLTTAPQARKLPERTFEANSEIDEYHAAVIQARDAGKTLPTQPEAYKGWLGRRFAPQPGEPQTAALVENSTSIKAYRTTRLLRRAAAADKQGSSQWLTRPEVLFSGLLEIIEPDAFPELLRRGVGRHCAFGFGMLLLGPPR